jgi:hypothetical protein
MAEISTAESKSCSRCSFIGSLDNFVKDDRFKLGVRPECKNCYNADRRKWHAAMSADKRWIKNQKTIARRKKRYHSDPEFRAYLMRKGRETKLRHDYNLEPEDAQGLLKEQEGFCKICGRDITKDFHVDHIKGTKIVRGLLCGPCNRAIGLLKESIPALTKAIAYLEVDYGKKA